MVLGLFSRKKEHPAAVESVRSAGRRSRDRYLPADRIELNDNPLRRALQLERYGVILANRDRWRNQPEGANVLADTAREVDEAYALVPEGYVSLPQTINDYPGCPETTIETEPFLLSKTAVTNEQFQKFVDSGGYENLEYWPEDTWPHLIDFKDLTGHPGPRFWEQGRHDRSLSRHPVVGVCYVEAFAYTRWAGMRLPSEAEWQMAASWRIRSCAHVMRRYPWGDALNTSRCNLWASNIGRTLEVTELSSGAAPNGVLQLIGNVWEWTSTNFEATDDQGRTVIGDMLTKSIRGGAFDTYFASQATSFFRTGLGILFRTHNTGFRCAMDVDQNDTRSKI